MTIFFMLVNLKCYSQQSNCNQEVYRNNLRDKIPKSVCIPKNHLIRDIISQEDLNNDGLEDFVITHSKSKIKDTDTLFVSIYSQKIDSIYTFKKKLGNLYPMFLDDYDSDIYITKSENVKELVSYSGNYPLNKLEFLKNKIVINFEIAEGETMELYFVYRKEEDNWFLKWGIYESKLTRTEQEILGDDNDFVPVKQKIYYKKNEQISIDSFNYFNWI